MAAFGLPGGPEIWIILAVVLVIFGPTQLPKLAKMFGKSAKALREGIDGKLEDEEKPADKPAEKPTEKPTEKPAEQVRPDADESTDIPKLL
jgi:sec-independent protein translocase protein TatA